MTFTFWAAFKEISLMFFIRYENAIIPEFPLTQQISLYLFG